MKILLPSAILLCCFMLTSFKGSSQPGNGNSSDRMFFRAKLFAANGNIADGNMVVFDDDLSNGYDGNDAVKMMNPGENFGMRRQSRILAIEARNVVTHEDTIYYDIRNLLPQVYQVKFAPQFMSAVSLYPVLLDNYMHTEHPVSTTDSTFFFFTVNSNPATSAFDRFKLVFRPQPVGAPLPLTFTSLKAGWQADKTINIQWEVEEEMNVDHYRVERSHNGLQFTAIAKVIASRDIATRRKYRYTDRLPLGEAPYYRITGVDIDGRRTYSKIIKLNTAAAETMLSVYPNPLTIPQMQVKVAGPAGNYELALINNAGQKVFSSRLRVNQPGQVQTVSPGKQVINGSYTLILTAEDGATQVQQVIINR